MVETFFLDWGLAFGAGILFAAAGRNEIASARSPMRSRTFALGFAYLVAGVLGVSLLLYVLNPAWMWMYFFKPQLPIAVTTLAFAIYPISFVAGFSVGAELGRGARAAAWAGAGAVGVLLSVAEYVTRDRLFHFGTHIEYLANLAPGGFEDGIRPEAWVLLLWGIPSLVALAALTVVIARRDAARAPERERRGTVPASA